MFENAKGRVYIVDDDDPVRDSLKTLLEAFGLDVRDFASCKEFMQELDGSEQGCLLLDLHLPVMSGLEFMERFSQRLHGLPVIMITGRGDPATLARAKLAGVSAFLEKPFEEEALLDTIGRLLPVLENDPNRAVHPDRPAT
ncbi:MAG TPA: response regulator [Arenibaculum sp.]|nr:response regulator [Arenibaculum sp.]